jgi:hypothetical protein
MEEIEAMRRRIKKMKQASILEHYDFTMLLHQLEAVEKKIKK